MHTEPASCIVTCITYNFHQTLPSKVTHKVTDTPIFIQCMHTNIGITRVYARTCINTLVCKLRHAAFSEMHTCVPWIWAHTHGLPKAAPGAYGSAKQTNRRTAMPGAGPAAAMTRPVPRSFPPERAGACVWHSGSVRHIHEPRLEPRQTPSLSPSCTFQQYHIHASLPLLPSPNPFFHTRPSVSVCFIFQIMHIHFCLQPGHWASLSQSL